ncbi:MAG: hypothetical protein AAF916_11760 [Planctomycetota bacterium]
MAKKTKQIAEKLGATIKGKLATGPGGGAFGAARITALAAEFQARLQPGTGERPGRPTDPSWNQYGRLPMSESTAAKLKDMADAVSENGRKVTPMQVAARLVEKALTPSNE